MRRNPWSRMTRTGTTSGWWAANRIWQRRIQYRMGRWYVDFVLLAPRGWEPGKKIEKGVWTVARARLLRQEAGALVQVRGHIDWLHSLYFAGDLLYPEGRVPEIEATTERKALLAAKKMVTGWAEEHIPPLELLAGESAKRNGFYRSKRKPWWEKVPEYLSELEEIKRQRHPKGYTRAEKSRIAILEKNIQHAKRKIQDMAEEEHQKLRKSLILQASCPHCGAGQGSVCVTPSGDPAGYSRKTRSRFHAPRWRRLDELMQSELWVLAQLPFAVENPKGKEVRKRHTQKQRRQRGKRLTEEQTEKFLPPGVGDRKREFVARIESYRPALLRQYADQIEQGKPAWYFESSYILKHARQVGMPVAELVHLLRETALRRETETAWRHRRAYGYVDWSNVVPEGDKPYWTDSTGERHRRDYEFVWKNVFGEPDAGTAGAGPGPFGREHVAQVVKSVHIRVPPDSDWPDDYYFALFRLVDGRWGYVEAWNDSTGWGCQDSNAYAVSDTLDGLIPQMSDRGRYQLGFESPLQRLSAAFVK